jgi:polyhydroxybutyrate depolymerase
MRKALNRISLCVVLAAGCSASSRNVASGGAGASGGSGDASGGSGGSSGSGAGTSGGAGVGTGGTGGSAEPMDASSSDGPSGGDVTVTDVGSGSDGAGPHTPTPSAGCGKTNPAKGMRTIMTSGMTANYNVSLPPNYDANRPMPLGFGFHGYNNPACGPTGGECQGFNGLPAITVFMKSITAGWEGQPQPLAENLKFYEDVLALMKNEYCVDLSRIFIAGVSSGGQFIEHIACNDGDSLWQVTAVSAYVDKGADTNCKGTPPVLITQGATETDVNISTPMMFAKRNGCSGTPPAGAAQALTDMKAAFNMGKVDVRCVDWEGCTANPVRYCISSQMTYGGLTHGWPRIGTMLISDFQSMLK